MLYPKSDHPELLHAHRLRAALGVTVALFFVTALGAVIISTPPAPTHLSVNCVETGVAGPLTDAPTGVTGCVRPFDVPAPQIATPHPKDVIKPANPDPAANATTDDPPISTF